METERAARRRDRVIGLRMSNPLVGPVFRARVAEACVVEGTPLGSTIEQLAPKFKGVEQSLLDGVGVGLVEYAKGRAVLHGSAVAHRDEGVALVGSSGAGKSTLAAHLNSRCGWRFLSDAMTVVDPATLAILPLRRRFRLKDDSIAVLGMEPTSHPIDDSLTLKRAVPCFDAATGNPQVLLRRVVVLEAAQELSICQLGPTDAVLALVVHAYLSSCLEPDQSRTLLDLATSLVQLGVQVHLMKYPRNWDNLFQIEELLQRL